MIPVPDFVNCTKRGNKPLLKAILFEMLDNFHCFIKQSRDLPFFKTFIAMKKH